MVSRGAGRSAVAASAYLSCSRMINEYDGVQHDYTRKQGLVWQAVFLPDMAPAEWQDREKLWNAVEEAEKTRDSRLAREFVTALPIELSREQQTALLQDFVREQFVAEGMCADVAIHDTDGHNPHAHILLTVRPLTEAGAWQYKTEKEYLCVKDGEERGFTAAEFKSAQAEGWEKQYPYKVGKRKCICPHPRSRSTDMNEPTSIRKAQSMGGRIPSLSGGTARNNCLPGARRGPQQRTAVWSWPAMRSASTTAAMRREGWKNGPPSTRVWRLRRWSGAALSPTAVS